ncbi:cytochrome P450 alkane hydroxylase [Purpureocillium lavendulum]|uniref:Cytochrome P450 alkane hydroxylase n=1 Tax=Purpureocillium lavendulum TaxID=1247861 RepID=A0AB34G2V8_9HYPO|nr:cytochrome P450 alkane hydroxylase [Purpureocillium lavendulum]
MLTVVAPSLATVAMAVPAVLTVLWIAQRMLIEYRLSKNPGVRAPAIANNPLSAIYWFLEAAYMQANNRLLDYYNSIYRYATPGAPNIVEMTFASRRILLTREPEHVKTVLTSKFADFGKGDMFHDAWSPFLGDSIFTTDGARWQKSRALIRPMFTRERVRDLHIFDRWASALLEKLPSTPGATGGPSETVDVCDLFYRMTLDVTTDFLLGQSVGALDNPRSDFSRAFMEVQRMQMILTILYPFRWLVPQAKYRSGIKLIESFMDPYISATLRLTPSELEALSKSDREFSFLHHIALFSRDPKVIRDQIMAVLLAGRDTTAATLSWCVYELANAPAVWARLRSDVLARVGAHRAPSYDDLKALTYLTHTLNETLRLYPAVPYNLRSCDIAFAPTSYHGLNLHKPTVESSTLPGQPGQPDIAALPGDIIIYSTLAMHRRADLYPPVSPTFADPAVFSPDRWDHWTPKPWHYVPFNGGPRICIGQNFALTEMAFTLVRLLQKYERVEYRGDWAAQFHKAEIVGCPGHGVPVAFFEPSEP